jgi:uncharacterized membrane protein YraQ (UPF0718 family)
MIGSFFKYLIIGICAIVALKIAFGLAMGLLGLAIGAIPLVIIGYVAYKVIGNNKKKDRQISDADRRWLNS